MNSKDCSKLLKSSKKAERVGVGQNRQGVLWDYDILSADPAITWETVQNSQDRSSQGFLFGYGTPAMTAILSGGLTLYHWIL